jgi:hypothetical protein
MIAGRPVDAAGGHEPSCAVDQWREYAEGLRSVLEAIQGHRAWAGGWQAGYMEVQRIAADALADNPVTNGCKSGP